MLAAGVVLFHYQLTWSYDDSFTGLFDAGWVGVDVFFILSGFILTHVYQAQLEQGSYRHVPFLLARLARIFPMHALMMGFTLVMVTGATLIGAEFDRSRLTAAGFVQSLLMVHAWFPTDVQNWWNGPSWSLSAEWSAYLVFPVYAWLGLKLRKRPLVLITFAVASFLLLDLVYRTAFGKALPYAQGSLGVLRIAPEFLYGVGLYCLGQRLSPTRVLVLTATLLAGASMLILMHLRADSRLIVAAGGPLVLSLALLTKAGVDGRLARPWMLLAGEVSYALYLVHMPLAILWKNVLGELTGRGKDYRMDAPELLALFSLTLALAYAAHFLVERPARKWIRRKGETLWARPDPLVGASGLTVQAGHGLPKSSAPNCTRENQLQRSGGSGPQ